MGKLGFAQIRSPYNGFNGEERIEETSWLPVLVLKASAKEITKTRQGENTKQSLSFSAFEVSCFRDSLILRRVSSPKSWRLRQRRLLSGVVRMR